MSAFREIEGLVKEYPMDMRYQVILGDVYMQNGKQQEAYDIYQKVLASEPDNVMARFSLASYYEQTGQKDLYRQQIDSLLLNKKVPADTKLNVMRQIIAQNEQAEADSTDVISLFDRILQQDTEDDQIPMLYSQYLWAKNLKEASVPVLERVVQIDPTNKAARLMLLEIAVQKSDFDQVIKICEPGIEATPDALEFYFYLAIAYNQAERHDEALAICRKALENATPDSKKEVLSDFYSIMGDIYHTKKQMADAYNAYDSALVYNPSNIGALNNYAYYLSVERRDLDKAEEMSYKTVKAEPDNATFLDTYAWILFEKGNYAEARIYIDNAMKSDQEKSDVIVEHCGDIYYMTGDVDGALKYWQQALDMGSKSKTLKEKIYCGMRKILYLLLLMVGLAGCRSSKQAAGIAVPETAHYLSSRLQLTIPSGTNGSITTGGTMKMKGGERVQLSILMPILRTEIARLEITPDEILLVDRMNKRYVRASRSELNDILPKEARFSKLEKLLLDASLPEGKSELSGKELGIPSLEKAKVRLYDFSSKEFVMTPTEISDRYTQVPLTELLNMLTKL